MRKHRFWLTAASAAIVLAGLRAGSPPSAEPSSVSSEPLAARGVAGHSIEWAVVGVRELAAARPEQAAATEETEKEQPLLPWKHLPVPPGAPRRFEARHPETEAIRAPRLASPPLASSFEALPDNGTVIPPDTNGGAGPNHLVTILNSQMRVQDRSGKALMTISHESFWSKVTSGLSISDPKVFYDPTTDRWIAAAIAGPNSKDSSVLVGVSQAGDPGGLWNLYRVDADPADAVWADFPTLGFNKDWIAIQVNMHDVTTSTQGSPFRWTQIYAFDKANLLAGGTDARHTLFVRSDLGSGQVPAATYDAAEPALYFLEDWDGNSNGQGVIALFSISGPVGSEVFRSIGFSVADATWDFLPPGGNDFAPQQGNSTKIQLNNSDFNQVVFRNGLITAAHTVFLPAGGAATRSAIQWWQLTSDGFIVQRGRLDDAAGQTFYAFPTVAPNRNNDLLIGYSSYSAQQFASGGYVFRAGGDALGSLRDPALLKNGEAAYVRVSSTRRNRWGDYSSSAVDPVNGLDFWTIQEYAAAPSLTSSAWGTWWGQVGAESGAPVALPVASFVSPESTVAGQLVTFSDSSTGATQWFWNFGDGTTSTERNPIHVFGVSGTPVVAETAVNQTGAATTRRTIIVAPPPKSQPAPVSGAPHRARAVTPRH